jgi:signal transduction histidine kinase
MPTGTVPATEPPEWVTLTGASDVAPLAAVSRGRVLAPIAFGALAVLVVVMLSGAMAASRLAEKEAVHDAARRADVVADTVVQPALTDSLLSGDPKAFAAMDRAVRSHVLDDLSQRVKIWTPQGRIVYSDEPALVGKVFPLPEDERQVLVHPTTRAEVSALQGEENAFERRLGPRLLEVYRPVWTPSGAPLLFETYASYDHVGARTGQLWRGFAGTTASSLLALIVLIVPVLWQLLGKVRRHQDQREALLTRAVEASTDERRRIAGTLHDGVIQELTGASFAVSSAAARATAVGQHDLAAALRDAAATVRKTITGMRSLLVDIYPPNLRTSGLVPALDDLATSLRSREVEVSLDLAPDAVTDLDPATERLIYRVVHECLHNTMRHARAKHVTITLSRHADATVLSVRDDGIGFEPTEVLQDRDRRCVGVSALVDDVRGAGCDLMLRTAPGAGTHWMLRVPT